MAKVGVDKVRSVAVLAHSGAGKTSLIDAMLYAAGANTRLGKVNDGTSMCDYNADEIERKITIDSKVLHVDWNGFCIYLLDTPGYADFIGEVIAALRACDSGLVLIDATCGVEVGTERVWELLNQHNLPRAIFINKLDKENADFSAVLSEIKKRLGKKCLAFQFPVGSEASFKESVDLLNQEALNGLTDADKAKAEELRKELIEAVAESDDALLEKYLEGEELLPFEVIHKAARSAVLSGKIVPVFCGAATKEIGAKGLLTGINDFLTSPQDRGKIQAQDLKGKENRDVQISADGSFTAQVFKTILDPYVGQLTLFRIFSGNLSANSGFYNSTKEVKERIGKIYLLQGKEQESIESASCGDIAAVAKLKDTATGDTLCSETDPIVFEPIVFPEPAISSSVKPKSRSDEEKISSALSKLTNEDRTFKISRDQVTKELIISGIGDLHLDVMVHRLKKRFEVEVELGVPKVAYKETITRGAKAQGKYKKQSGGRGQYGDVWLELEPLSSGENFEFVDKIFGGAVPKNYIPSVEKGVRQAMAQGVLAGYPLVNIRVKIYDGSYHQVDSSDMAFQIAGGMALRKGLLEAKAVLLEPIMDVEVLVPEEYMGSISSDLSSRRGRILGMDVRSNMQVVKAQVPLAEMFKYATELRSMTQGRASYSMKFSRYDQVPQKISASIIEKAKKEKEEKE